MSKTKVTTTVISSAVLAACGSSNYYAAADPPENQDVICKREAQVGSHLKVMKCRKVKDFTLQDKERIFGFQLSNAQFGNAAAHSGGRAAATEGSCGQLRDD